MDVNSGGGDGYHYDNRSCFNRRNEHWDDRDNGDKEPNNDSRSENGCGTGVQSQAHGAQQFRNHGESKFQERAQDRGQFQYQVYDSQRLNANSFENYSRPNDRHGHPHEQQFGRYDSRGSAYGNPQRNGNVREGYSDIHGDARPSYQGSRQHDERDRQQFRSGNNDQGYGGGQMNQYGTMNKEYVNSGGRDGYQNDNKSCSNRRDERWYDRDNVGQDPKNDSRSGNGSGTGVQSQAHGAEQFRSHGAREQGPEYGQSKYHVYDSQRLNANSFGNYGWPNYQYGRSDNCHGGPDEQQQFRGYNSRGNAYGNPQRDDDVRERYSDNRGDARPSYQGSRQRDERDHRQYRSGSNHQGYGGGQMNRYRNQDSRHGWDNDGHDFGRIRDNRGNGYDGRYGSSSNRFDKSEGCDNVGGGRGSFQNDNGFENGYRDGFERRFYEDGNAGKHLENYTPEDRIPSPRDIDELMSDTIERYRGIFQLSQYQDVEVLNSPIADLLASWEDTNFHSKILDILLGMNYTEVRKIQAAMIPQIRAGYDVIGQAESGAGKTAAFGLPILDHILKMEKNDRNARLGISPIALVFAPEREIAQQIADSLRQYAHKTDIKICLAIGLKSHSQCLAEIRNGCDVLVGTTNRLMDLIGKGEINLNSLKFLVFDEADRLFNDLQKESLCLLSAIINENCFIRKKNKLQILLTTATFDNAVEKVANTLMKKVDGHNDVVKIVLASGRLSNRVDYRFYEAGRARKHEILKTILRDTNDQGEIPKTLIFVLEKSSCDFLASKIQMIAQKLKEDQKLEEDIGVQTLHGDRSLEGRVRMISAFKNGSLKILVTTDELIHCFDVVDLERVINFDLPDGSADTGADTFNRRSRLTGRMHRGICHSFVNPRFDNDVRLVPKLIELVESVGNPDDVREVPPFMLNLARRAAEMELAAARQTMRIKDLESTGYCVEFDDATAKFYTLEHGLVVMDVMENPPKLGEFYELFDNTYWRSSIESTDCEFLVVNDVVFVKTYAITPNVQELPKDMAKRFRNRVWSPFLKYLHDPEEKFIDNFDGGVVGLIKAKYCPNETTLFEVVEVYEEKVPSMGTGSVRATPWTMECVGKNMEATCLHDREHTLALNQYAFVSDQEQQIGIVFLAEHLNIGGNGEDKKQGINSHCSYIFNRELGIIRWMYPVNTISGQPNHTGKESDELNEGIDPKLRLGKWVRFIPNEKKEKNENGPPKVRGIYRITAGGVRIVSDQKLTSTTYGVLEIEVSFLFDHKGLENPENQKLDWVLREQLLSEKAHFWDLSLGRVEIYPRISKVILENIENHRKNLSRADRDKLKEEAILVVVRARVHKNWLENFEKYPEHGVFFAHRVRRIHYLDGGRLIFKP
ncbi:hypothetical protein B9Z55_024166 [Caenorhabditis nigoni]|uniref:RNA helicase n=1 Tax=Caenorhabditis nigoni TaxID=1611254 RepID=A0A2G5STI8_9PELO|nr:hypothetical protein B9Z55_024166 [Caenorhabditis nigoni]